jgi:hypothetical protein
MKVEVCWVDRMLPNETFRCTHASSGTHVLRLENRPNQQQSAVGMRDITHIISIPFEQIRWWKEYD